MAAPLRIYFAAALFNAREVAINFLLTWELENMGRNVFLPQRDGMDGGVLIESIEQRLGKSTGPAAHKDLIYLLDVGWEIPRSDVVISNLDEPLDEGVVVEMCAARAYSMPVVGYRTDVRTPFGDSTTQYRGLHPFPAMACDELIIAPGYSSFAYGANRYITLLANRIDDRVRDVSSRSESRARPADYPPAYLAQAKMLAAYIFGDLEGSDTHAFRNSKILETIAQRYVACKDEITKLSPHITHVDL